MKPHSIRHLLWPGLVVLALGCSNSPVIHGFTADRTSIHYGDSVHLSWTVENATSLSLAPVGDVSGTSLDLKPHATTQYVLTASNEDGKVVSQPVTVNVADDATRMTFSPTDFGTAGLSIDIPNLGSGEQLAIFTLNLGGKDTVDPGDGSATPSVTVQLTGTGPATRTAAALRSGAPLPSARLPLAVLKRLRLHREARLGHDRVHAEEAKAMAPIWAARADGTYVQPARSVASTAATAPDSASFCTLENGSAPFVRRAATKKAESAHLIIYVDNQDLNHYQSYPNIWQTLADDWENDIYPADTQTFGAESDVDGNGKLIVFFTDALGSIQNGGIIMGYYYSPDVANALDSTPNCSGTGSNHADMFYLNDIQNITNAGYTSDDTINFEYPDTLGHEFQHLINYNEHAILHGATTPESTWINEGLSTMAEDIVGYNWNEPVIPSDANLYLDRVPFDTDESSPNYFPYHTYYNASLTKWDGDPIGNYAGAHTFFRYFTDRLGKQILGQLDQSKDVGVTHLESVLGESFQTAYEDWTTALVFSNETFSPSTVFDFTGANWTRLHKKLSVAQDCTNLQQPVPGREGYVDYKTLDGSGTGTATLRTDGWGVFVSPPGTGATAHLTITPAPSDTGATYAVVVRFSGNLPPGTPTPCP